MGFASWDRLMLKVPSSPQRFGSSVRHRTARCRCFAAQMGCRSRVRLTQVMCAETQTHTLDHPTTACPPFSEQHRHEQTHPPDGPHNKAVGAAKDRLHSRRFAATGEGRQRPAGQLARCRQKQLTRETWQGSPRPCSQWRFWQRHRCAGQRHDTGFCHSVWAFCAPGDRPAQRSPLRSRSESFVTLRQTPGP